MTFDKLDDGLVLKDRLRLGNGLGLDDGLALEDDGLGFSNGLGLNDDGLGLKCDETSVNLKI
jgi:hypothetical protein